MKRDPLGKFFLFALIAAAAGLAAVTRAPEARWVQRATKAAVIGPWIEKLADLYRQPPGPDEASDLEGGEEIIYRIGSQGNQTRPTVLVEAGRGLPAGSSHPSSELASPPSTNIERSGRTGDAYVVESGDERDVGAASAARTDHIRAICHALPTSALRSAAFHYRC